MRSIEFIFVYIFFSDIGNPLLNVNNIVLINTVH